MDSGTVGGSEKAEASMWAEDENSEFPLSFATALFSFLYHLATYEASEKDIRL